MDVFGLEVILTSNKYILAKYNKNTFYTIYKIFLCCEPPPLGKLDYCQLEPLHNNDRPKNYIMLYWS